MYLCVKGIDFPLSTIFLLYFGNCFDNVAFFVDHFIPCAKIVSLRLQQY